MVTLVHGEICIASPSQQRKVSTHDLSTTFQVLILPDKKRPHFQFNHIIYTSPTALCKARFTRKGKTNEWCGPKHLYVLRNGSWINLKGQHAVLV